jgi:hypothetical protein
MRRAILIGLAAALTLSLGVGTAQAAKAKKLSTQIEIEGLAPNAEFTFIGDVHSRKNKCERNRTVTLFYSAGGGKFEDVGTDITDHTGDWEISPNLVGENRFYATVDKKKIGQGDKKVVCKAAQSPEFQLEA